MSVTKTLGGDRLGSGKKMKVEMHGYERSTHDMSYIWRSTMSPGTLVPFMCKVALPADTWDIDLDTVFNTHPTVGPLFGSYKVQLDIFQAPLRLYQAQLHNNTLGIGRDMSQVKLPQIRMTAPLAPDYTTTPIDNSQINPSSLLAYLGIRGIGQNVAAEAKYRDFNAVPILAYWEIYKNYYANKQEEIGAVLHTPSEALVETVDNVKISDPAIDQTIPQYPTTTTAIMVLGSVIKIAYTGTTPIPEQIMINTVELGLKSMAELGTGTYTNAGGVLSVPFRQTYWGNLTATYWNYISNSNINTGKPAVATFELANIDDMRRAILTVWDTTVNPFVINGADLEPYKWLYEQPNDIPNILSSQEGLALKTYQSDLFNNWLKTENIDAITTASTIDTSGGGFTIDQLILGKQVYNLLNRINVSGGTYDDWLEVVYDHNPMRRAESPIYHGGLIKELIFQQVISNSQSEDQPLGTLAGRGTLSGKHKGGKIIIKVDEPSIIMGIISLTPRIDYSQGNDWHVNLKTMDDLHKPQFDQIGFQDLITEYMAWWDTNITDNNQVTQFSAGKQPAWINYMTDYNRCYGNFAIADNEMFMTLNRRYELSDTDQLKDITTYIDPSKFNYIFAQTSLDAQNFWAQVAVNCTVRRKMSAKIMPNI